MKIASTLRDANDGAPFLDNMNLDKTESGGSRVAVPAPTATADRSYQPGCGGHRDELTPTGKTVLTLMSTCLLPHTR